MNFSPASGRIFQKFKGAAMKFLIAAIFIITFFTGCSVIPLGIEPSSHQLRTEQGQNKSYRIIGRVEDSDGYFSLFSFIPLGEISIKQTFERIARENGGDALINIRYWLKDSFFIVGTQHSLIVKADVIKYE